MRLAHRHILWSTGLASLGGVLVFAFIILLATVLRDMLEMFVEGRLNFAVTVKLSSLAMPYVMVHALPLGLLTGVLLALGRLSADNEILSFRSSGMGVAQLSSSIVALALVSVVAALVVNLEFGPRARATYREELAGAVNENPLGFILERTFVKDFPGYVIYVGDKNGEELSDLWVWRLDDQSRVRRLIRAETGYFHFDGGTKQLDLRLVNGFLEDRDAKDPESFRSSTGRYMSFGETSLPLSLSGILGPSTFKRKLYWMPFAELLATRRALEEDLRSGVADPVEGPAQLLELKMTLQEKLSSAFASLSLVLVAIPLGIVSRRKESSANLFLALGLAFVYYLCMMVVGWMGEIAWIHPDLLYWVPNFAFQGLGIWMIVRMDRGMRKKALA